MSADPQELYDLLRHRPGEYCPADDIRARLACTPGELGGMLETLGKTGVLVAADPGLGMRLTEIPERLASVEIRHRLGTGTFGCRAVVVDRVASTNDTAAELAATLPAGTVVTAESQSRGRGRRGRRWLAEPGKSLMFSLILPPAAPTIAHSLLVAGAVARALIRHCGIPVRMKWPNDLVVAGVPSPESVDSRMRKLGGVLCELRNGAAIAGVGLNVNQERFPTELPLAVSIRQLSGRSCNRNQLLKQILRELEVEYGRASEAGPEESVQRMRPLSITLGRRVTVSTEAGSVTGTATDLHADGSLVLETDDGARHRLLSGDVTSAAHAAA